MSEEERNLIYDLAGEGKSTISPDLQEYIHVLGYRPDGAEIGKKGRNG